MNKLRLLPILAALAFSASVLAQQPSQPRPATPPAAPASAPQAEQLTPEQRAALERQNVQMAQAAQQVMQLVDANRVGEIWDGASAAMKRTVTRDEFVKQITIDRNRLGAVSNRANPAISRSMFKAGAQVPEGLYINIATPTKFANQPQPVRELVSFRLDEDRQWRVSGYSLR